MLSAERACELLSYDPNTGVFTWRATNCKGAIAGTPYRMGRYIRIQIDGKLYRAHRVAWLMVTGKWPAADIDHIDGNGQNNAWSNLRDVPRSVNCQNRRAPKKATASGLLGVSRHGTLWRADICVDGARHHLGRFKSKELAHEAYVQAKRRLHAGCTI